MDAYVGKHLIVRTTEVTAPTPHAGLRSSDEERPN